MPVPDKFPSLAAMPVTPSARRGRVRQRIAMDLHAFARHEGQLLSLGLALRLFLLTPGFQFVLARRIGEALAGIALIGRPLRRVWWWRTCRAFGSEIAIGATVEGGLYIPHPYGIVIGVATIGHDVTILQNVTIGNRGEAGAAGAVIGDGAYLGAGAAIIGAVTVGARARVGANAVVTRDVPPAATAIGIPARAIR